MSAATVPLTLWADQELKVCTKCRIAQLPSDYYMNGKGSPHSECKSCHKKRHFGQQSRPGWKEKRREWNRQGNGMKMPEVDWQALFLKQFQSCAICGSKNPGARWATDHNHETGEVRGILCNRCNLAISGIEQPEFRAKALKYLGVQ
jgi:hypothetical protein